MDQQTAAPTAPRYGAATLGETTKTTSTVTRIKWGGVIKGIVAVTAVAAVGIGAYYGAAWLFGGAPAGTALAQIGSRT